MQKGVTSEQKTHSRNLRNQPKPKGRPQRSREGLRTLQPVATDKENLTGRQLTLTSMVKDGKTELKLDKKTEKKDVKLSTKSIQTKAEVTAEDLISDAGPSENYWQTVAERRRITLEAALIENKDLYEQIEMLKKENETLRQMVDESKSLVDVLNDMVGEESGIDLAEASTVSVDEEEEQTSTKKSKKDE